MKPEIYRTCQSPECGLYGIEVCADEDIFPERCLECGAASRLRATYHGVEAASVDHFYAVASAMAREHALLRRLGDAGAASGGDEPRLADLKRILVGLDCSLCGQPLLDHQV